MWHNELTSTLFSQQQQQQRLENYAGQILSLCNLTSEQVFLKLNQFTVSQYLAWY